MKSLVVAGNNIIKIILECERNLDDLPRVVGRISNEVKIHGHPIPTAIIIELIDEWLKERKEGKKVNGMRGFDEEKVALAFDRVSRKWSGVTEN